MNKKIVTLLTAFVILFSGFVPFNFTKAESFDMSIESVKAFSGVQRLVNLTTGEIKSEITIKNQGSDITPFIISMICKGTEEHYQTVNVSLIESEYFSSGFTKTVTATNNCSDDENAFLKIMVFDNKDDLNLIAEEEVFPSEKELDLLGLNISGVPVDGFSPDKLEYEISMPYGDPLPDNFEIFPYNDAVKQDISKPEEYGDDLTVKLSANGKEKIYKFTINEGLDPSIARISNLKIDGKSASETIIPFVPYETSRYADVDEPFTDFDGVNSAITAGIFSRVWAIVTMQPM